MRRTKIVATLGPATESREMIEKLILLGVNVFRLNFSHSDHIHHGALIKRIRAIAGRLDVPVAILQDIAGPKIRVGAIDGIMRLDPGDRLYIYPGPTRSQEREITINHPEILGSLKHGDHIYFADGAIQAEVLVNEGDRVTATVLTGGKLTSRKGVNLPGADLVLDPLTPKDRADIAFGVKEGVDFIALSFVRSAADVHQARALLAGIADTPIIAKIEKAAALDHLEEIMQAADGIMVARGDLGVELGVHRVPVVQKKIIAMALRHGIPVITATQMLTSMLTSPYPTRAEVSDIANAVLDGTDAVMLSDETAVGKYPEAAIQVLQATITETETIYPHSQEPPAVTGTLDAMAAAANELADRTGANGIVAFTYSGASARMVATCRPRPRIIATTSNSMTYRRLTLVWGVEPFFVEFAHANSDAAISLFVKQARQARLIDENDVFVLTIGHHSNESGTTNQIQLMDRAAFDRLQAMIKQMKPPRPSRK
ncbi:MAG: pyruvate kinase [Deltaproteobacteria bacterium RIFOXYD12_FULL_57_12]|nr:MAG: pyruvate kinase [Deltaproteobacteria bacterium RIFOXYD12_FULL_57_12]